MNNSTTNSLKETILENDPFAPINEEDAIEIYNSTEFDTFLDVHRIVTESVEGVAIVISTFAYIFLVVTMLKSKQLKISRLNIYILNISILHIINSPFSILMFTGNFLTVAIIESYISVLILYMFLAFLLGLDWLITAKRPPCNAFFDKYQKKFLAVLYSLTFFEWIFTFWYSKTHHMVRSLLLFFFYILLLTGSVLLNVIKGCSKLDPNSASTSYAFFCFNVIVFSMIPLFVHHFLYYVVEFHLVIVLTAVVPIILFLLHPVFIVYSLGRRSRSFRIAFLRTIALLRRKSAPEELEESENDEPISSAQIRSNSTDEELVLTENSDVKYEIILR